MNISSITWQHGIEHITNKLQYKCFYSIGTPYLMRSNCSDEHIPYYCVNRYNGSNAKSE